jgi:hypothetical protein
LVHNPVIPKELEMELNLDTVPFISNDQLQTTLWGTSATPEHVNEAVRINQETRLVALKVSLFTLRGLALLAFFPAGVLPGYIRGEIPAGTPAEPEQRDVGSVVAIDQASRGPVV